MSSLWSHVQTATAALPAWSAGPRGTTSEVLEVALAGGGSLVAVAEWQPKRAAAVIVIHGVGGSSDDTYVVRAARFFGRKGYHTIRLNQRGSGRGVGKAPVLYHAGMSDDVAALRTMIEARDDVSALAVLGFSLGGHVALAHAADVENARGKLAAVCTVSAPIDLAATLAKFDANRTTPSRIYERMIVRSLVDKARALPNNPFTAAELDGIRDVRAFDDVVTCRSHGFTGIPDYHARASVGPRLSRIRVPTLAIHSVDDPIVPAAPLAAAPTSPAIEVHLLPRGGHVGFAASPRQMFGATDAVLRAAAHFEKYLT